MSDNIYIVGIEVLNIGGIDRFRTKVGMTAIIVGENGAGKTSLLQAIQTVLEGGHNPDLIRKGCEFGEVILTLSNGTGIRKVIAEKESTLEIRTEDGGIVRGPATYIKSIVPSVSFDPIGFLESDPKERAAFLLKTLPLSFEDKEVNAVLDIPTAVGPVSLQKLNEIREGRYEQRSEINRQVRDSQGTVADMEKTLPPASDKNWGVERDRLNSEISAVGSRIETIAAEVALHAEQAKGKKREEITEQIAALQEALNKFIQVVDRTAAETLAEQTRELEAQRAALSAELGQAKERADAEQRAAGVRQAIDLRKEAIRGFESKSERLTEVIKALDDLKVKKLRELPIEGLDLTVEKGKPIIKINGIPLDRLNRQQQLFIAIRAVSLAAGRLPLILCEVAELDDDHLKELTSATEDAGIQLMVARWENGERLAVRSRAREQVTA